MRISTRCIEKEIFSPTREGVGRKGLPVRQVPVGFNPFEDEDEYQQFLQKNDSAKKWVSPEEVIDPECLKTEEEIYEEIDTEIKSLHEADAEIGYEFEWYEGEDLYNKKPEVRVSDRGAGYIRAACYNGYGTVHIIREKNNSAPMLDKGWYRKKDFVVSKNSKKS